MRYVKGTLDMSLHILAHSTLTSLATYSDVDWVAALILSAPHLATAFTSVITLSPCLLSGRLLYLVPVLRPHTMAVAHAVA